MHGILYYNVCMMDNDSKAMIQIKKGALEFCVLAVIAGKERYGYEIVRILAGKGITTYEGTIYPLLSRLKKENLVSSTWRETENGKPRKYYRITDKGQTALAGFKKDWKYFVDSVSHILKEG